MSIANVRYRLIGTTDISWGSGSLNYIDPVTGLPATMGQVNASSLPFKSINATVDNLVDGSGNLSPIVNNLTVGGNEAVTGSLTVASLSSAGFVKNTAAGLLTGGNSLAVADIPAGIDAVKIGAGTVSNTEFGYLDGVTSSIQTQLNTISLGGAKIAGDIVQIVHTETGAYATASTTIPLDDTIPQIGEGTEYMTLSITPTAVTNYLYVESIINGAPGAPSVLVAALFNTDVDAANALTATAYQSLGGSMSQMILCHRLLATGLVGATTFRVRVGNNSGYAFYFNGYGGARVLGGVLFSSMTIYEIKV